MVNPFNNYLCFQIIFGTHIFTYRLLRTLIETIVHTMITDE